MSQSFSNLDIEQHQLSFASTNQHKLTVNQKKAARRARQLIGKNKGRWLKEQHKNYVQFINSNQNFFFTNDRRRYDKVFMNMSNHIKSRNAEQCRTHHQKLLRKFKTFENILGVLTQQNAGIKRNDIKKIIESSDICNIENEFNPQSYEEQQKCFDFNSTNFIQNVTLNPSFHNFQSDEINFDIFYDKSQNHIE